MIFSLLILFTLIILNGFFAGSEIAFISVNERKLKIMKDEGDKKAELVLKLKKSPNRFLSTIQIGVSIASIFSGVFAADAFSSFLTDWILNFSNLPIAAIKTFSMLFVTIITSYLMLLFGELLPKRIAMASPEKFAYIAVYPLSAIAVIATPLIRILSLSTNFFLNLLGISLDKTGEKITEEEIRIMVEDGKIHQIEKEMIKSIFEFDDTQVSKIMTHRTDIVAINSEDNLNQILDLISKERFSRYPVYEDSIDNIIGVIHLRELLRYIASRNKTDFDLRDLLGEAYFIPESKLANQLFKELQANKIHMAIVIDEYGGTAGIITMENLIEEIMGDILDEYDMEKNRLSIMELDKGTYLVNGSSDLEDLEDILDIELPTHKYGTVSGFIIGHLGRIPRKRDLLEHSSDFNFNGYLFSIKSLEGRVVSKVEISKDDENKGK